MNSAHDSAPWLRHYGAVPAHLDYPECTLYQMIAAAAARAPDVVAWDFFDQRSTYRQLLADVDTCADALAALGLAANDRFLIAMPTTPQAVIAFYAANKLGAVPAFIHPLSSTPEIEHYLDATGAEIALILDAFYPHVAAAQPRRPLHRLLVARVGDHLSPLRRAAYWWRRGRHHMRLPQDTRLRWWRDVMREPHALADAAERGTDEPAAILFSGGTTALPKGIVLSNRNFIAQGLQAASWARIGGGSSILAILPIFHGFGLGVCVNAALMAGATSILVPQFDAAVVARLIRRKRPSFLVGVPTLFAALTREGRLADTDLSFLRAAFCGADSLPRQVKEDFEALVAKGGGKIHLLEGYGLTEAVTGIMAMPIDHYREGSIGVPFPDMSAQVCVPGTDQEVSVGNEGEICIAGPAVMLGYLDDREATRHALRRHADGRVWLHTGDLGRRDADGFFYFSVRLKRMIKSSGFNVYPAQLEGVLARHPLVAEVCVIGVPDPAQIERVVAWVVPKDVAAINERSAEDLIAYCRENVIKWSCPREIRFCSSLPRTRVGKIDFRSLQQQYLPEEQRQVREPIADCGGDRVARALALHGVRQIFTLCGGHTAPILAAAKARGIRIVDVRHEVNAVFAADAYARLTGIPGVAVVTAGPGVSNTITALKNAQLAQSPLVLIGGAAPTALQGRGALQDIDQRALVEPHVKACKRVRRVADLDRAITDAFALAQNGVPGPVFVECPVDLLYGEALIRGWYKDASARGNSFAAIAQRWYLRRHIDRMFGGKGEASTPAVAPIAPPAPPAADVERAAAALLRAERPLLLVGSQALAVAARAPAVAAAVAALGMPVYLSGMARGLLGRGHPLQCLHQRRLALREADCVVLAGVPNDFRLDYGRHVRSHARVIAANRSKREARLNRRPDVSVIGDAGRFLELLAERLVGRAQNDTWMQNLRARDAEREVEIDQAAQHRGAHVNPLALFREIDRVASDNAIFIADGGDFVATAAYTLHPRGPLGWLDPGVFGTLGVGAGFLLGAAQSRPDAERWLIWGDGACGFSLIEFDSFVRHGIAVIAVVGNDAGWTQIAREQTKMLGDDVGTVLAHTDYDRVASGLGAEGILVRSQEELPSALALAQSLARAGRPVLLNVWLEPNRFREGSISM